MKNTNKEAIEGEFVFDDRHYSHQNKNRFGMGALLLIFLGFIFLFNNLGLLPQDAWKTIWQYWPLLLIFWGLKLILGKSKIGNLLLTLIEIIFTILVLLFLLGPQNLSSIIPSQFLQYFRFNPY